ncbi:MAG: hypothetical protein JF615_11660 [Asticcacaulis sp.]|nr:hypothetical protein [Asticcacaulis sp.]
MWHSTRVVATGLFWLMVVMFTLGGVTQLGLQPLAGEITLGFVAAVVLLRIVLVPRFLKAAVFNVVGCIAFLALVFVLMKTGLTGQA